METTVDRVMRAFAKKHQTMTEDQERLIRREVSAFVAELQAGNGFKPTKA